MAGESQILAIERTIVYLEVVCDLANVIEVEVLQDLDFAAVLGLLGVGAGLGRLVAKT